MPELTRPKQQLEDNQEESKDLGLLQPNDETNLKMNRKRVSFSEGQDNNSLNHSPMDLGIKSCLKSGDGSPEKNMNAHKRKDNRNVSHDASSALLPGNKVDTDSVGDTIERLEREETEFLETIEDSFTKLFMKTQYNLANDMKKSFTSAASHNEGSNSLLTTRSGDSAVFKDRLLAYTLGRVIQQQESIHCEDSSHDSSLFTKKIEDTIQRGEEVLENSLNYVQIIRNLTQLAKSLNENFSKAKSIKHRVVLDDPLLQKYINSGVMSRIMNSERSPTKDWKKIEEKLRGKELDTLDLDKKRRIYSTFVDEIAENDGYLCKILNYNLVTMIIKMKDYEQFNDTLNELENNSDINNKNESQDDFRGPQIQGSTNRGVEIQSTRVNMTITPVKSLVSDNKSANKIEKINIESKIKPAEQHKPEVSNTKIEDAKKQRVEVVKFDSSSDSSDEAPPKATMTLKKQSYPVPIPAPAPQKITSNAIKEKQANAQKINMLVQDDMSFDDSSDDSDVDSDEFDDNISEMRPNGKIAFGRTQTTVPDNMKFECSPSELLDDFFDDPLEHPLMPSNKFVKHKSEVVKPLGMGLLRTHKSIMEGLGPKKTKDDNAKAEIPVKAPKEKMKRLEDDDDELK